MLRFRSTRSCSCSLTRGEGTHGASRPRAVTSRNAAPRRWAPEASFQEVPGGRGPWTGEVRVGVGTTEPTASFPRSRGQGPERTQRPGSPDPGTAAPLGPRLLRQVGWATCPLQPSSRKPAPPRSPSRQVTQPRSNFVEPTGAAESCEERCGCRTGSDGVRSWAHRRLLSCLLCDWPHHFTSPSWTFLNLRGTRACVPTPEGCWRAQMITPVKTLGRHPPETTGKMRHKHATVLSSPGTRGNEGHGPGRREASPVTAPFTPQETFWAQ